MDNLISAITDEEILKSLNAVCYKYTDNEFTKLLKLWKEYKGYE